MTPHAIWFGADDRPLAGSLHVPAGRCTGGVLICAPFGYESVCAHRTLRRLADRLAADGRLVLRFDYEGTGSSSGTGSEQDLLERWVASVTAGVTELRRRGIQRPALVGVRLGAALACAAARQDGDLGPLALWAPVTSGRRYHRELRAQAATTAGGVVGDGSLNAFGFLVPAGVQRVLKTWDPLQGIGVRSDVLVVQSPGWRDAAAAGQDLRQAGLRPAFAEVAGTSDVLEQDAELTLVPQRLLDSVSGWLATRPDSPEPSSITALPHADRTRVFDTGEAVVQEEIVSVPPAGLHGVLTRPSNGAIAHAVIFLNNGVNPAAGPGRAWVEFARSLALSGITSLRLDLSGLGESPDRGRRRVKRDNPVPPTAGQEVLASADFLRGRGASHVTVVGLCSGAHIAVRCASYAGRIDQVFAINPPLYTLSDIGLGPWRRKLWSLTAFPLSKRPVRRLANRLPERFWAVLDRLGLFPSATRHLREAARRGASVHLIFSDGDKSLEDLQSRAGRALRRLVCSGQISLDVIAGMDHSMSDRLWRSTVLTVLRDAIVPSTQPLDSYSRR